MESGGFGRGRTVLQLYGLTEEEINIVEDSSGLRVGEGSE